MSPTPVIVSAVRTPIGKAGRSLAPLGAAQLGKVAVVEALRRSGVPTEDVQDLALGEVLQGGGDMARYITTEVGLDHIPGVAVQRQCASGLQAVSQVAADIAAGMISAGIGGGAESMTQMPQVMRRSPYPFGGVEPWVSPSHPDSPEAPNMKMGITVGENSAEEAGITREEQDEWSYHSHQRAIAATDDGRFAEEIVPVEVPVGRGETRTVDTDEHPRRDTTPERLAKLPALFKPGGTVTAGNSSGINDGAAALVLTSDTYAADHGLDVLASIRSWASVGVEPRRTGLAPTVAIPTALERAGLTTDDVDLVEINEAFASMAVACARILGFDHDIVNVNGGAVGLGHPVACSGARVLVTLVHELRRRGGGIGVASLCAGGGMGAAMVVEV